MSPLTNRSHRIAKHSADTQRMFSVAQVEVFKQGDSRKHAWRHICKGVLCKAAAETARAAAGGSSSTSKGFGHRSSRNRRTAAAGAMSCATAIAAVAAVPSGVSAHDISLRNSLKRQL